MASHWNDGDSLMLIQFVKDGLTWDEISQRLRKTVASVRSRYNRVSNSREANAKADPPQNAMQTIPVDEFARAAAAGSVNHAPVVTSSWTPDQIDITKIWDNAEKDAAKRIEKAKEHSRFSAKLSSSRVTAIAFVSDQHIAPGAPVDFRRMREDAELIRDTPDLYAILGGDGVDNHIKHFSAVLAARSQPHDQWLLFEHYLSILKEKLLVVTSGNHDLWTNQYAGVDMVSWLCSQHKFAYAPYEARIEAHAGSQKYKIAVRHQYRLNSSFNQTHSVKQWLRLGEEEFDIGCIGHHHEAALEQTVYRGRHVWACRPGAYQITSSYSMQYGWNSAIPTCPTFVLYPDRWDIVGFKSVHDVPKYLRAINGN